LSEPRSSETRRASKISSSFFTSSLIIEKSCEEKRLNHSLVKSWLALIAGKFPAMQDKETIAEERKRMLESRYEEWKYEL